MRLAEITFLILNILVFILLMLKKVHVIASKTGMVFCEIKIATLQNTEYLYSAKCWLSGVVVNLGLITFLSQSAVVAISEDVITMQIQCSFQSIGLVR